MLGLDKPPKLAFKVIFDGDLLRQLGSIRTYRDDVGSYFSSFPFAVGQRVVLEPLSFESVRPSTKAVEAVILSFLESVLGSIHEEASVAEELRYWNFGERRGEAIQVESSVTAIAQDNLAWVVVHRANFADLGVFRKGLMVRIGYGKNTSNQPTSPGLSLTFLPLPSLGVERVRGSSTENCDVSTGIKKRQVRRERTTRRRGR